MIKNTYIINEKINKDKEYLMFKISQEIKQSVSMMNKIINDILENKDDSKVIEEDIEYVKDINRDLQVITNNILDISAMDSAKLKIINHEYSVPYLLEDIKLRCKSKIPETIEFRTNYSSYIPEKLYGDDIRLKQIIYTILDNSIKHTKKGFIELDVQCIIKHDVCRLIIIMEDSGNGMDIKQVNELLEIQKELSEDNIKMLDSKNLNLKIVKKLVHFIGGTISITSLLNVGTKIRVIIDQKIPKSEINKDSKLIEKYKVMLNDKKKIVVITEVEEIKNQIRKLILGEYDVEYLQTSKACLDKIRAREIIDLVIVQEDMSKIDSSELLQKLKVERDFNKNIIVLTKTIDTEKRKDLLHKGFKEVITLPLDRSSLNDKIKSILDKKK